MKMRVTGSLMNRGIEGRQRGAGAQGARLLENPAGDLSPLSVLCVFSRLRPRGLMLTGPTGKCS